MNPKYEPLAQILASYLDGNLNGSATKMEDFREALKNDVFRQTVIAEINAFLADPSSKYRELIWSKHYCIDEVDTEKEAKAVFEYIPDGADLIKDLG